jgi:hypothetical protein
MEPADMTSQTEARYFMFARCGRAVISVERDTNEMDMASTIRDIISGQVEPPVSIFCAEDNRFWDVTEDIARMIVDRAAAHGIELSQRLLEWLTNNGVSMRSAYALGMEAA